MCYRLFNGAPKLLLVTHTKILPFLINFPIIREQRSKTLLGASLFQRVDDVPSKTGALYQDITTFPGLSTKTEKIIKHCNIIFKYYGIIRYPALFKINNQTCKYITNPN